MSRAFRPSSIAALTCLVALSACPPPEPTPDASVEIDAGMVTPPMPCDSPEDCRALNQVCRANECTLDVPCSDDLECGLGERCVGHQCRFRGCTANSECPTNFCDVSTFSCAECAQTSDCPDERPVCDTQLRQCVQCGRDADCQPPGPAHCSSSGRCTGCLTDAHCPNGLKCSSGNFCVGAPANSPCPEGVSCGAGLACVTLNSENVCLPACNLYAPTCAAGQVCFSLTYSSTNSHVFEAQGPIGVCFNEQPGLRGAREPCAATMTGSNCQPNLVCLAETASLSLCRPYCDPLTSGMCSAGEKCVGFVGDFNGREFGACLPDTGFGAKCTGDSNCRTGLTCQPWDDPSEFDEVGTICQFNLGDGGAGAPCAPQVLVDGGIISADRACRSGRCVNDPLAFSPPTDPYFCAASCATDNDCGDAGICDVDFLVTTPSGTPSYERGCRPRCAEERDCAKYDAGVTCKVRVVASASSPQFTTTCSPAPGMLGAGRACSSNSNCRSNFCRLDDSRGVRRQGVCMSPCLDGSACAALGGEGACQPTSILASRGFDSVSPTADDKILAPKLCSGSVCAQNADCSADGGTWVCAVSSDPMMPLTGAVLRCEPPTGAVLRAGDVCTTDAQCASGVCGDLVAPSMGTGKMCFEACTAGTMCPGTTSCRALGMSVKVAAANVLLSSCAP